MMAQHWQAERTGATRPVAGAVRDHNLECCATLVHHDLLSANISLRAETVSDDAVIGQARDHLLNLRVIYA